MAAVNGLRYRIETSLNEKPKVNRHKRRFFCLVRIEGTLCSDAGECRWIFCDFHERLRNSTAKKRRSKPMETQYAAEERAEEKAAVLSYQCVN